jgi:hypothetical protein
MSLTAPKVSLPWLKMPDLPADTQLPTYLKYKEALITPARDQLACAACWSLVVSDCLADRIMIATQGSTRLLLSGQELLSCFQNHEGCGVGGSPEDAYDYTSTKGLPLDENYKYEAKVTKCSHAPGPRYFSVQGSEKNICKPLDSISETKKQQRILDNIRQMKMELFLHGPFSGTLGVYEDLYQYDGRSVYEVGKGSKYIGGHAIEIIGWCDAGVNDREPGFQGAYWIAKNSWGLKWQTGLTIDRSFFYVRMGNNEADIESRASSVLPRLDGIALPTEFDMKTVRYESYSEYTGDPERKNFFTYLKSGH